MSSSATSPSFQTKFGICASSASRSFVHVGEVPHGDQQGMSGRRRVGLERHLARSSGRRPAAPRSRRTARRPAEDGGSSTAARCPGVRSSSANVSIAGPGTSMSAASRTRISRFRNEARFVDRLPSAMLTSPNPRTRSPSSERAFCAVRTIASSSASSESATSGTSYRPPCLPVVKVPASSGRSVDRHDNAGALISPRVHAHGDRRQNVDHRRRPGDLRPRRRRRHLDARDLPGIGASQHQRCAIPLRQARRSAPRCARAPRTCGEHPASPDARRHGRVWRLRRPRDGLGARSPVRSRARDRRGTPLSANRRRAPPQRPGPLLRSDRTLRRRVRPLAGAGEGPHGTAVLPAAPPVLGHVALLPRTDVGPPNRSDRRTRLRQQPRRHRRRHPAAEISDETAALLEARDANRPDSPPPERT